MTLKLNFVRETSQARLYEKPGAGRQWVPRSVCPATFKFPPVAGQLTLHEVVIEDWWLGKNPWPEQKQKSLNL